MNVEYYRNLFVDWVGRAARKRSEQKFWCWDEICFMGLKSKVWIFWNFGTQA
jgi:hypothetical protein